MIQVPPKGSAVEGIHYHGFLPLPPLEIHGVGHTAISKGAFTRHTHVLRIDLTAVRDDERAFGDVVDRMQAEPLILAGKYLDRWIVMEVKGPI
jgi:hypothetical protein